MKRRARPSPAAGWRVFLVALPLLGACGGLQGLPTAPASQPPAIPGPFEKYDPVRPPAYKRAPDRVTKPPSPSPGRIDGDGDAPQNGG